MVHLSPLHMKENIHWTFPYHDKKKIKLQSQHTNMYVLKCQSSLTEAELMQGLKCCSFWTDAQRN
jgi:hypothetical protein